VQEQWLRCRSEGMLSTRPLGVFQALPLITCFIYISFPRSVFIVLSQMDQAARASTPTSRLNLEPIKQPAKPGP